MAGGTNFAAVLDEKLRNSPSSKPSPARGVQPRHVPTVQAFVFEFAASFGTTRDLRAARFSCTYSRGFVHPAESGRTRQPDDAPRNRPNRTLSPQAQSALDRLNALGAGIHADFTPQELRHAFRTLARRYHPDRHPGSSATEKARHSRQFIQLHDAYRELQGAIPLAA
jgi:hypothetical protein